MMMDKDNKYLPSLAKKLFPCFALMLLAGCQNLPAPSASVEKSKTSRHLDCPGPGCPSYIREILQQDELDTLHRFVNVKTEKENYALAAILKTLIEDQQSNNNSIIKDKINASIKFYVTNDISQYKSTQDFYKAKIRHAEIINAMLNNQNIIMERNITLMNQMIVDLIDEDKLSEQALKSAIWHLSKINRATQKRVKQLQLINIKHTIVAHEMDESTYSIQQRELKKHTKIFEELANRTIKLINVFEMKLSGLEYITQKSKIEG
ncbi:MAG: hypothetical protein ACRBCI_15660 [Cellvibrionaceae bacterium]